MREIKFRGVRIDNAEWVYGFYSVVNINHGIWARIKSEFPEWYQVHPESVGQFTGLKDKEGNDIYGGDVIRDCLTKAKLQVCFGRNKNNAYHGWYCRYIEIDVKDTNLNGDYDTNINSQIEIIGNIYENSELINL